LIDDKDYRDQLIKLQVEAIGGEMEGAGLYVSSADHKVDWIVIKGICDWADGNKKVKQESASKKGGEECCRVYRGVIEVRRPEANMMTGPVHAQLTGFPKRPLPHGQPAGLHAQPAGFPVRRERGAQLTS
jgi:hypothetical protein